MSGSQELEMVNFLCRLSKSDHSKLKTISLAYNRSMTAQVRNYIQEDWRRTGDAYEAHLDGKSDAHYEMALDAELEKKGMHRSYEYPDGDYVVKSIKTGKEITEKDEVPF